MVNIWLMMVNNITAWWLLLTPLKNDGVSSSVGMIFPFPTEWKNKKCSKPPTSIYRIRISIDIYKSCWTSIKFHRLFSSSSMTFHGGEWDQPRRRSMTKGCQVSSHPQVSMVTLGMGWSPPWHTTFWHSFWHTIKCIYIHSYIYIFTSVYIYTY